MMQQAFCNRITGCIDISDKIRYTVSNHYKSKRSTFRKLFVPDS